MVSDSREREREREVIIKSIEFLGFSRFLDSNGDADDNDSDYLSLPILLSDRLLKSASDSESDVAKRAYQLSSLLRSAVLVAASASKTYDRPIRRILTSSSASALYRSLSLLRRIGRHSSSLLRLRLDATSGDLRKLLSILDAAVSDLQWLLSVYDPTSGIVPSLPPIASTDPILSWVWSYITAIHKPGPASDRVDSANALANLALLRDRNKKIIIEEGGIPPFLTLLRDSCSVDAQIASTIALLNLCSNQDNVGLILKNRAVPIIVHVLSDSPAKLQSHVANLVSRMAAQDPIAQEEFARENAIRPLVSLLCSEVPADDTKVACSEALWMLSRSSVLNTRKITETRGLLSLSKIVEKEERKLQYNCLMTLMEIAMVAESNEEIRRLTFQSNSLAAKLVIDQFLTLAIQQKCTLVLKIAAIRSIGSLARTFPARETRVLSTLVSQLEYWNWEVAAEAAIALGKFAGPRNYLRKEHSKTVADFGAVPLLIRLVRSQEKAQLPALVLVCWLAVEVEVPEHNVMERVLGMLHPVARTAVAQHPAMRELLPQAIRHLELYRVGAHSHKQPV